MAGKLERIIVIGLGSPIMSDDAVGLKISEAVESLKIPDVDTLQEAVGGLEIIPMVRGYRYAVIVDAIQTYDYEPGTVLIFNPEDFDSTIADVPAHDVNLATAIKMGRTLEPEMMPLAIRFVAVEVRDLQTVSESMTSEVEDAVESAKDAVLHIIDGFRSQDARDRIS
ncbi:MAG: hydrogenase maturation protease [Candidatus Methanoplasma sp.]|jgi:hydrogenase maturation protease|nr:hydrogenase maturation protease [Candidatus Methanoplasma sp.]